VYCTVVYKIMYSSGIKILVFLMVTNEKHSCELVLHLTFSFTTATLIHLNIYFLYNKVG